MRLESKRTRPRDRPRQQRASADSQTELRVEALICELIRKYELDLRGLQLYTEAASGHYLYTPLLAARAGAERVFAETRDSRFGDADRVARQTRQAAARLEVDSKLELFFAPDRDALAKSDIITNSGFVRPLTAEKVAWLKPTAVIPLMWEPCEYRPGDLDLDACRDKGVLVLGTNEHEPPCDMLPYNGFLAMKLLFELGLEGFQSKILLLGNHRLLGRPIYQHLRAVGCSVDWFGDAEDESTGPGCADSARYKDLARHLAESDVRYDAVLVAEISQGRRLLGKGGLLSWHELRAHNPAIALGVIAGNVDAEGLTRSGLAHLPSAVQPFPYLSYQPASLGPRMVLDLYAAGLKVAQVAARARLSGKSLPESVEVALKDSPALDFEGDRSWRN